MLRKLKILRYIIAGSFLLCGVVTCVSAQDKKPGIKLSQIKKDTIQNRLWQGLVVEFDIEPLVEAVVMNNSTYSTQGNLQLNLKRKYFPVVELGVGGADKTTSGGIDYKTNGVFGKIGMDFSLMKPKPGAKLINNYFLAGARLGMTHFKYSISNISYTDDYWGGTGNINIESVPSTKFWVEIVAGVRVEVYKRIYLGWTVRNKHLINQDKVGVVSPWYIPGYGKNNSSLWGFSYIIGYHI